MIEQVRMAIYVTGALTLLDVVFKIRGKLAGDNNENDKKLPSWFSKIVEIFKMLLLVVLFSPINEELYFEGLDQMMMLVLAVDQVLYISEMAKKEYATGEDASFSKIWESNAGLFEFGNRLFLCLYLLYIGWFINGPVEIVNMQYILFVSSIIYAYQNIVYMLS
jgi:hypothetical protein